MLAQPTHSILHIAKWLVLATLIGIVVGGLDAMFLKLLDACIGARNHVPCFYIALPFALYIIALLARKVAKAHKDYSTDAVIHRINTYKEVSILSVIKAFVLSIVTMAVGGSAGKEAPCADVGAGISALVGRVLHLSVPDQRRLMICGVSAGFAGVFGVPVSGALFGLEVLWVGHMFYEVMFPALVAGITAFGVTSYLGVNYIYHPLSFSPVFSELFLLKVIIAGLFFGLVSVLFIEISKFTRVIFRFITVRSSMFMTCMVGGLILVLIGAFISPLYLGLGMAGIDGPLSGAALQSPFGFLYKIITTSVTLAAGGIGGIITPIFFVGAQAGAMLSEFLRVDSATLAALGVVAVLAGAANTPLSASIMAIELFGAAIAPYATVTCVISFLITGRQSIFPHQRISVGSGKIEDERNTQTYYGPRRRASDKKELMPSHTTTTAQMRRRLKRFWPGHQARLAAIERERKRIEKK
ncbi:MAG: chloride channel protein [Elusimicrobiaceae bacterium]|nr:chloride channel protein [Elusimicrobiaceae bacterium]MBP5617441.1 chloride channel protein [Elusimicrobiaceae bacterium]